MDEGLEHEAEGHEKGEDEHLHAQAGGGVITRERTGGEKTSTGFGWGWGWGWGCGWGWGSGDDGQGQSRWCGVIARERTSPMRFPAKSKKTLCWQAAMGKG